MASDDFDRANGLIGVGVPAWTQYAGSGGTLSVSSNQVVGSNSSDKIYYYSGAASTADQYAQLRLKGGADLDLGPAVRVGADSGFDCYFLLSSNDNWSKMDGGSFSNIGSYGSSPVVDDVVRIEVEGSTLRGFVNGSPTVTPSVTDTSFSAAGSGVGVFHYEQTHAFDDWAGGDLAAAAEKQSFYAFRRRSVTR